MVQECDIYMSNLVTVDMRDVSPRFVYKEERAGHAMYIDTRKPVGMGLQCFNCFNSWGNTDKVIRISNTLSSAKFYFVNWSQIVRRGCDGRPDQTVF